MANDLTAGLPAELHLRQQQYAYYRDMLLNFSSELVSERERELNKILQILKQKPFDPDVKRIIDILERMLEKVEWKTLGEVIISLKTGLNPRNYFVLNTEDAKNYYITIREMVGGKLMITEKTDKINDEALKKCNNRSNLEV